MARPGEFGTLDELASADMNALPGGVLGYAQVTSSQSGITSLTDLTGLSVTVDVVASRRIRVSGGGILLSVDTTAAHAQVHVREASTTLGKWSTRLERPTSGTLITATPSVVLTPSAGAHSYKLSLEVNIGSVGITQAADRPAFILVEDIGSSA